MGLCMHEAWGIFPEGHGDIFPEGHGAWAYRDAWVHLVPFAFAFPAHALNNLMEGKVVAMPKPIPISSDLVAASMKSQRAFLLCSALICCSPSTAVMSFSRMGIDKHMSH